jgi:hypothetical protein
VAELLVAVQQPVELLRAQREQLLDQQVLLPVQRQLALPPLVPLVPLVPQLQLQQQLVQLLRHPSLLQLWQLLLSQQPPSPIPALLLQQHLLMVVQQTNWCHA